MIETKVINPVPAHEIGEAFDDFMRTFEAFKEANDERLSELQTRYASSALTEEKLARIEEALDRQQQIVDELTLRNRRQSAENGQADDDGLQLAHKAAFQSYVRKGDVASFLDLENKALSVGSEADGGYLVPDATERRIMQALKDESPIRGISGSISISTSVYRRPFLLSGAAGGWIGETGARPQTATPSLTELSFPAMELYAMPAATLRLLDDAAVDVAAFIADETRTAFAVQESSAFVSGDGLNQPKGFLSYGAVPNGSWSWGQLGYVATGADGAFAEIDSADALIDLVFALKSAYRRNARFQNRLTRWFASLLTKAELSLAALAWATLERRCSATRSRNATIRLHPRQFVPPSATSLWLSVVDRLTY
jgi:HK97 family phage major capsid protein